MNIQRLLSKPGIPVRDQVKWKTVTATTDFKTGATAEIEVPEQWSQDAANILASKYLRRAGVPYEEDMRYVSEEIPSFLLRRQKAEGSTRTEGETSAHQAFHRMAGHWTYVGWKHGYFDHITQETVSPSFHKREKRTPQESEAHAFYDEIYLCLANQIAAPNSPQWFNTGLWWAYGIAGPDSGQWAINYPSGEPFLTGNSYEYPQAHACFIQPISDDLVNPGGIMDLWVREARVFKSGSGSGSNMSAIRGKGEPLSGGGKSSGLMSFLEIGDRAAGAIQSGGTTRRAAVMRILDLDHPEIEDFISWKTTEGRKARAMSVGSDGEFPDTWEGEAIRSVSGQNSNNSIRVTDKFLERVDEDGAWNLYNRTDKQINKTLFAKDLWKKICENTWSSGDPGVQFDDIIQRWHTCKADGRINGSNPCSEYVFLDDTACNLASINLVRFKEKDAFDHSTFEHVCRLWTIVLDISVTMASFPSREIALGSYNYRTLGLGYANAGGLLMRYGLAYDSDIGRNLIANITALMHGVACHTSKELGKELGPFPRWEANKDSMLAVMDKHQDAALGLHGPFDNVVWKYYGSLGKIDDPGFRNAQVTLLAPTGTISFVMDCDTTGIEPEFALVKHKNLAGGGGMAITNPAVKWGLAALGYRPHTINLILAHISTTGTVEGCRDLKRHHHAVFDCATPPQGYSRCIEPLAHVRMVAAVQPFLSGAVSKTVNLPHSATVDDINFIYREAHRLGLKAVAPYRDGSKEAQPLNAKKEDIVKDMRDGLISRNEAVVLISGDESANISETVFINQIKNELAESTRIPSGYDKSRPGRKTLPSRRKGWTYKLRVEDQTLYLRTGEYADGTLGEIFVTSSKEGSTARGYIEGWAKSISQGLQYGVPLSEYVESFTHTRFEPAGIVEGHERIKMCSSVFDLIMRILGLDYLGMEHLANIAALQEPVKTEKPMFIDTGIWTWMGSRPTTGAFPPERVVPRYQPSGNLCPDCGSELRRTGTCTACPKCSFNTGCG